VVWQTEHSTNLDKRRLICYLSNHSKAIKYLAHGQDWTLHGSLPLDLYTIPLILNAKQGQRNTNFSNILVRFEEGIELTSALTIHQQPGDFFTKLDAMLKDQTLKTVTVFWSWLKTK